MPGKQVQEIAQELGMSNDDIMERLKSLHIEADSPEAMLEEDQVIKLKAFIKVSMSTSAPVPKPKKKAAPKPKKAAEKKEKPAKKTTKKKAASKDEDKEEKPKKKTTSKKTTAKKKTEDEKATEKKTKKAAEDKKEAKEEKPAAKKKTTKEAKAEKPKKKPGDKKKDKEPLEVSEDTDTTEDSDDKKDVKVRQKHSPAAKKSRAFDEEESFFTPEEEEQQEFDRDDATVLPTAADVIREEERPRRLKVKKIKRRKVVPPAKQQKTASQRKKVSSTPTADKDKIITLSEGVTVKELADKLGMLVKEIIKKLMEMGYFFNQNQVLDKELAIKLAEEFGYIAEIVSFEEDMTIQLEETHEPEHVERAPVVTVMGHVDHGKTSLMDVIRKANVVDNEHGGITQHIGAYTVNYNGKDVVFLDTPGHKAFTAMRARGAEVTDIVILVVAADDGVKQQTIEAIDHAKAAKVPIIVAINKIDKPEANVERVKQQLVEQELVPEDWGGETVICEVSAKKELGIENLMDMIFLLTEMKELKADIKRRAQGYIIEARKEQGRGNVATVLVLDGILNIGDPFIAGAASGKVRVMIDDRGERIETARAAKPVEVAGFQDMPHAGDKFQSIDDETQARKIQSFRKQRDREAGLAKTARISLDQLFDKISEGDIKELNVIIKADVQGSAEVLETSVKELSTADVTIKVIRNGVGAITEDDVLLAAASNAVIVGFNIRPRSDAVKLAKKENVDIRLHTVIYEVTNEIRDAMERKLEPVLKEEYRGRAEVRDLFRLPKGKIIAGCFVLDGNISRKNEVRLLRDDVIIYTGTIASLRRFKDDVKEVKKDFECGIGLENFNDIKINDVIEAFETVKVAAKLE